MAVSKEELRVLFVEDRQEDVDLMLLVLKHEFNVVWKRVETGNALLVALDENWDVIICDHNMPRLRADAALEIVRMYLSHRVFQHLPFIVVSGHVDEDVALHMLKKGAHDFVGKDRLQRLPLAIHRELRHVSERVRYKIMLEESYDATIAAWGKALEMRDFYTKGHTERVTTCALRLAMHLELPHSQFVDINRGSLLHDIGKMGIPDAVLLKRDTLTEEEMDIMKMHPVIARDMLKDIPFLRTALEIPYCHHERWNGSGYPQGLQGKDIPYNARLFSIVDVYDALTSDRPYRESWTKAEAIFYILDESGRLFDPELVQLFVEMVGRG